MPASTCHRRGRSGRRSAAPASSSPMRTSRSSSRRSSAAGLLAWRPSWARTCRGADSGADFQPRAGRGADSLHFRTRGARGARTGAGSDREACEDWRRESSGTRAHPRRSHRAPRHLQGAASRLQLLGLSDRAIEDLDSGKTLDATIGVPAPISGVVTERRERRAERGPGHAAVHRRRFVERVGGGRCLRERLCRRSASARAHHDHGVSDVLLEGRVDYIDPQVRAETRTAKVRVEVPNARDDLRLGMFVEAFSEARAGAISADSAQRRPERGRAHRGVSGRFEEPGSVHRT